MSGYRRWIAVVVSVGFVLAVLAAATAGRAAAAPAVQAGGDTLRLSMQRTFGYSAGSRIQGSFTMTARGPQDITSATFYIDGQEMGRATQAPFELKFSTSTYPAGSHALAVEAQLADGRTLRSEEIRADFLSGGQAMQDSQRIIIPLVGGVLLVTFIGIGGSFVMAGRNKEALRPGMPRHYGVVGGAICPRCSRPFARHAFSLNLLTGKLECCPYCRKWSIVRAATPAQLAAAEASELAGAQPDVRELSEDEKLRHRLEESRYR